MVSGGKVLQIHFFGDSQLLDTIVDDNRPKIAEKSKNSWVGGREVLSSTSKNRLFRWVDFFLSGRFEHFLASNWWFFGFFSYFWSISIEGRVQKQIINKENAFWSQLEAIRPLWTFNWYTNLCGFYPGGLFRQIFLKISHCVGRKSKILRFLKKKKKSQKASKTPYLTIRKGLVAIRHVSEELVQISHNFDFFGAAFFGLGFSR